MIEFQSTDIEILYCDGSWQATHDECRCDGPALIELDEQPLLRNCTFYVDDLQGDCAIVDQFKAFRKSGVAVVRSRGHFPFGAESGYSQTCRYAANHLRLTADLRWRRGDVVKRHVGVGALELPGRWLRYFCVPPCLHLAEGVRPGWHTIPGDPPGSGMIGHWHRPPLALVFERDDGVRVEIGCGDDVWRWEQNLGFGPENANVKILVVPGGLQIVREPLMTCEEVLPRPRDYRFTSYLAWWSPRDPDPVSLPALGEIRFAPDGEALLPDGEPGSLPAFSLDFASLPVPDTCRRTGASAAAAGNHAPICWRSNAVQKLARRLIRRLAAMGTEGVLQVRGVTPGACWDPRHVDRPGSGPLAHWDMSAILEFAEWTRQQLGPDWQIRVEGDGWNELPAMRGLMRENGFRTDDDSGDDEA